MCGLKCLKGCKCHTYPLQQEACCGLPFHGKFTFFFLDSNSHEYFNDLHNCTFSFLKAQCHQRGGASFPVHHLWPFCGERRFLAKLENRLWESIQKTTGQRREITGEKSRQLLSIEKRFIHFILEGRNYAFSNRAYRVFTNGGRWPLCFSEIKSSFSP